MAIIVSRWGHRDTISGLSSWRRNRNLSWTLWGEVAELRDSPYGNL